MVIAKFLDSMCLALRASGLWLRYAALQNLIPSFPWQGRDQILPSGNTGPTAVNSDKDHGREEKGKKKEKEFPVSQLSISYLSCLDFLLSLSPFSLNPQKGTLMWRLRKFNACNFVWPLSKRGCFQSSLHITSAQGRGRSRNAV